jgi:hypothetical protein
MTATKNENYCNNSWELGQQRTKVQLLSEFPLADDSSFPALNLFTLPVNSYHSVYTKHNKTMSNEPVHHELPNEPMHHELSSSTSDGSPGTFSKDPL